MNEETKLIFRTGEDRFQVKNLWVIALVIGLWVLSIILHVPGMP